MHIFFWRIAASISVVFGLAGPALGQDHLDPKTWTCAISNFYTKGDATAWRLATRKEVAAVGEKSSAQLLLDLLRYRSCAAEHGLDGLEGPVISAVAELGVRGPLDAALAQGFLKTLAEVAAKKSAAPARPNAYVPIRRGGGLMVHHKSQNVARTALLGQIKSGKLDPDDALKDTSCSKEEIDRLEERYGEEYAKLLRLACGGRFAGIPEAGTGPGLLAGISTISCLLATKKPSRSEVLTRRTQECLASVQLDNENPFTNGSTRPQNAGPGNSWSDLSAIADPVQDALAAAEEINRGFHSTSTRSSGTDPEVTTTHEVDASGVTGRLMKRETKSNGNWVKNEGFHLSGEDAYVINFQNGQPSNGAVFDESGGLIGDIQFNGNEAKVNYDGGWSTTHNYNPDTNTLSEPTSIDYEPPGGGPTTRFESDGQGGYTITTTFEDGATYTDYFDANGNKVRSKYTPAKKPEEGAGGQSASTPADPMPNTAECLALATFLNQTQIERDLEQTFGLDPRLIRPAPDADPDKFPEDFACLPGADTGLDEAFNCGRIVLCPGPAAIATADCGCGNLPTDVTFDRGCEMIMTCADGRPAKSVEGQCRCPNDEEALFIDTPRTGGPFDHSAGSRPRTR